MTMDFSLLILSFKVWAKSKKRSRERFFDFTDVFYGLFADQFFKNFRMISGEISEHLAV